MNTIGKILISLSILAYAVIPPIVDLTTDTHVFHEGWMPHARMHTVWLLGMTSGTGLIALFLLWVPGSDARSRVNLAALLSALVFVSFYLSAATISLYGGALSDMADGVQPGPMGIDANFLTFTVSAIFLVVGWLMCARNRVLS